MIEAIVWDFDGVIVDSEPLHYRAFLEVARAFDVTFSYDEYLDRFIGYDDRDAFRVMLGQQPGGSPNEDVNQLQQLCEDKAVAFEHCVAQGVNMLPGAAELIAEAHHAMPIAIASGATRHDIDLILNALGLTGSFQTIVSADDVAQSKPHPASYTMAAQHLGVAPGRCLAIEDTAAGIASARDAGLMTLAVMTTARDRTALLNAHRITDSLADVNLDTLQNWYAD